MDVSLQLGVFMVGIPLRLQATPPPPDPRPACYEEKTKITSRPRAFASRIKDVQACQQKCYAQKKWVFIRWCKFYTYNSKTKYCNMYKSSKGRRGNDAYTTAAKVSCKESRRSVREESTVAAGSGLIATDITDSEGNTSTTTVESTAANEPDIFEDEVDFDCDVDPTFFGSVQCGARYYVFGLPFEAFAISSMLWCFGVKLLMHRAMW